MDVAHELFEKRRLRHALFFAHLSLEKILKAHVCAETKDVPPRIHNLTRLVELCGLSLPAERMTLLRRFNTYQAQGRYPENLGKIYVAEQDARDLLAQL